METELFYLRDSRGNTGSSAMFWSLAGGYTTDLSKAEKFTREKAIDQYKCRETDIPLRCDLVDQFAYLAVDMQYLPATTNPSDSNCLLLGNDFDGNNVLFVAPGVKTYNFGKISPVSLVDTYALMSKDNRIACYSYEAIEKLARRVVSASFLETKKMLRKAKIKYIRPQVLTKERYRCCGDGCGRFVTESQYYGGCPNCDWSYCG
jgi:hypothetical protein